MDLDHLVMPESKRHVKRTLETSVTSQMFLLTKSGTVRAPK